MLAPLSGIAGIWGPSCIAAAQLALAEINAKGGIYGRKLDALFMDSNVEVLGRLSHDLHMLITAGAISGVVNMSVSDVRRGLNRVIAARVPHVFTPPFDGTEFSPHVFTIGATPGQQLLPAARQLAAMLRVRRWAIVGKNYVLSPISNNIAKQFISEAGGTVVFERYVPFGTDDPSILLDGLAAARPEIVFVSLVGQDAVEFNRVFAHAGLHRKMFRFTELVEENILLASGAENVKGLFTSSTYFASLTQDLQLDFSERYHAMHGSLAPTLNVIGQSLYEGIQFYANLAKQRLDETTGPIHYATARGGEFRSNWDKSDPVYLAEADGTRFHVIDRISRRF